MKTAADYVDHKGYIIKELARLESMPWSENDKVSETIFPYVIVEAINLLLNSQPIEDLKDNTLTGKLTKEMLNKIKND